MFPVCVWQVGITSEEIRECLVKINNNSFKDNLNSEIVIISKSKLRVYNKHVAGLLRDKWIQRKQWSDRHMDSDRWELIKLVSSDRAPVN